MDKILIVTICMLISLHLQSQKIDEILDHEDLRYSQVALSIRNIETNEVVYQHNGDILLTPASSLKLITIFTSLSTFGEDFKYRTTLGYQGNILSDGTLEGDLIIVGSGDPSLASPDEEVLDLQQLLADIKKVLKDSGIKCITGRVIVDDSIYDSEGIHHTWPWDDLTNYYASGAYGFNFRENYYDIQFRSSQTPGTPTDIVSVYPNIGLTSLENRVVSGPKGSGDNAYIYGDPYGYDRYIKGSIPPGRSNFEIYGAIPNPAMTFSELLTQYLRSQEIRVDWELIKDTDRPYTLAAYQSPELGTLARRANFESNNLYCEAFLKKLGSRDKSQGVDFEDGIDVVYTHLDEIGVGKKGLTMMDGSGLSLKNRISANFFTRFLAIITQRNSVDYVTNYLPRTGQEDTTLERFMTSSKSKGNVWLKSGSLGGVLSYTGIMQAQSGKWLTVSLISNGHTVGNSKIRNHFAKIIDGVYLNN